MKRLFGTSGIRGVFGKDLTPSKIIEIGLAIGTYYGKGKKALIGWDCRETSPAIVSLVTGGLLSTGIKIDKCGLISTPAFQKYMQDNKRYDFGLIVTASHNPPEYNGIKLIGRGGLEEDIHVEDDIEDILKRKNFMIVDWDRVGKFGDNIDVLGYYTKNLYMHVNKEAKKKGFKIALDFANCVSVITISPFLEKLNIGTKAYKINYVLDGRFPNRPSEPKPENLNELSKLVVDTKSDFGIGFDGDGDRAIIIDNEGKAWWGDAIGTLIARYLKDYGYKVSSVVTPVTSSSIVDIMLEPLNIKIYRTKVGAKNIVRVMRKEKSLLGFEENGGIIYAPHVYTRDGGITLVLIINILSFYKKPLSKLMKNMPELIQLKEKVFISSRSEIHNILNDIEEKLGINTYKIDKRDGVKLYYDIDKWVLVRPSGTEPIIRIFSEAPTREEAKQLIKKAKDIIKKHI